MSGAEIDTAPAATVLVEGRGRMEGWGMSWHRPQIVRLLILLLIGGVVVGWVRQRAHPVRVPRVTAEEMGRRVPDYQEALDLPKVPESSGAVIQQALEDALRGGVECRYWKTIRCPTSGFYIHVLNPLGTPETLVLYRMDRENERLQEMCGWNVYDGWPPITQAESGRLRERLIKGSQNME